MVVEQKIRHGELNKMLAKTIILADRVSIKLQAMNPCHAKIAFVDKHGAKNTTMS